MSMRAADLTSWSAPRFQPPGTADAWTRSIDLMAAVDFTPGWKRLKLISPGNTIRQVSILFQGKLDHPVLQEDMPSSESRFATYIFVSSDISSIRIELCLASTALDGFSATLRPISLLEYFYKTLPQSPRSPAEMVRYCYAPPFLCAISHAYPRPDAAAISEINRPAISVLMPLRDPDPKLLREAIESVRSQTYANWTLRIAGAGLLDGDTADYLTHLPGEDPRISLALADSPAALSDVLSTAFCPDLSPHVACVTALNQHDVLAPQSLEVCAILLSRNPTIEVVYTDHDVIDHDGRRREPAFKPDFSPDLLYSYDYMGCQFVHRAQNFRKVGGWRDPFSCARDYDLTLRVLEHIEADQVSHIPAVLYHRRQESGLVPIGSRAAAAECFRSALAGHLARRGISAAVVEPVT